MFSPHRACTFESAQCCWYTPNATNEECLQGEVPLYAVDATTAEHVQTAVKWASDNNIALSVRSTGHDLLGRSIRGDTLNIWVHNMKGISYIDSWTSNCSPGSQPVKAMQVLGGDQWGDVYTEQTLHDVLVVGGYS